jgi:hypothetical protein
MKCQIRWIDEKGKPTPDENDAVAMAHFHKPIWSVPTGAPDNRIMGYSDEIQESFPICQAHLDMVKLNFVAWTFTPIQIDAAVDEGLDIGASD